MGNYELTCINQDSNHIAVPFKSTYKQGVVSCNGEPNFNIGTWGQESRPKTLKKAI